MTDLSAPRGQHHDVIIVGGGQSGLSMAYCLKRRGISCLVLEQHRIAHAWREERWDTFCLVTPNWQCTLPGFPYAGGDPKGFMQKDAIIRYVEDYARFVDAEVLEGVAVTSLRRLGGHFEVVGTTGEFSAQQVVVATGAYHEGEIPPLSAGFPATMVQIHSSSYRNSGQLPEGAVLVVGSGQSGCQIAEDLHLAGRKVHLATGSAPRTPRRYRGRDVVEWLDQMGYYDMPIDEHPLRERVRAKANHYVTGRDGGRDIDLRRFALEGMELYGRLLGVNGSVLRFRDDLRQNLDQADAVAQSIKATIDRFIDSSGIEAPEEAPYLAPWQPSSVSGEVDMERAGITSVIWSMGFRTDFSWVDIPVFDGRGYPAHQRGVTPTPGLYFLGLPWLYTWGSGRFSGVAADAEYLAAQIDAARGAVAGAPAQSMNELALGS